MNVRRGLAITALALAMWAFAVFAAALAWQACAPVR